MANYEIIMKQKNSSGEYDILYPATTASQVSDVYNQEDTLSNNTKQVIGLNLDATPDDAFINIFSSEWKLITQIDNTVGMSGTYTVPDFFGDGKAFDIGVYMIGGGGSGAARTSTSGSVYCTGGASGFGKNFIIKSVIPGSQYSWVIGAGGKPGNGGTTSFNSVTALGGDKGDSDVNKTPFIPYGGQAPDRPSSIFSTLRNGNAPFGSCNIFTSIDELQDLASIFSPRFGQNSFDTTMITLGAGGSALAASSEGFYQKTEEIYGGKAGAGSNSLKGGDATGYGNGGGASAYFGRGTAVAGYGSDGAIFLYARRSA